MTILENLAFHLLKKKYKKKKSLILLVQFRSIFVINVEEIRIDWGRFLDKSRLTYYFNITVTNFVAKYVTHYCYFHRNQLLVSNFFCTKSEVFKINVTKGIKEMGNSGSLLDAIAYLETPLKPVSMNSTNTQKE